MRVSCLGAFLGLFVWLGRGGEEWEEALAGGETCDHKRLMHVLVRLRDQASSWTAERFVGVSDTERCVGRSAAGVKGLLNNGHTYSIQPERVHEPEYMDDGRVQGWTQKCVHSSANFR